LIPEPRGPYSPAVRAGDFLFLSGQGPIDPRTNQFCYGSIEEETRQVLENLRAVLEANGAGPGDVVKCSVFLRDGRDFEGMNRVYAEFFGATKPARTTVETKFADSKMKVEIDCVAYKPSR
jgi:2-iminobutanoate/2-iminopropanoate deaminase